MVEALEAGLAVYQGKALLNSVTGEDERLEVVLPLVKKYGAAVVAISNDENGISEDPDVRFELPFQVVGKELESFLILGLKKSSLSWKRNSLIGLTYH